MISFILKISEIVHRFDLTYDEARIVENAKNNLDKHLDPQLKASKNEIKEKEIIFAFFARYLIEQCRKILEM